ncbi:lysophospholipid acyltransferase family protein [Desulfobacula phenolica]|uniref:1-acyl-sn-glycerol-3-phosphate acyltransferase n=1 Tax=Desulfobacula phenolica TaxID=90732 RepID=A0A1H2DQ31_9BACT|nr:lysophospholipid acyltransferase family protein [Desulfobacula phenolica]SDT84861.1 1-acyl-sn-glycerol-3-phosphate acyltransferase [Desulfobacula phenolica]
MSFKSLGTAFFSYAYIAFVGLSSVIMFMVACLIRLLTQAFDRRLVLLNLFSSFWGSLYLWCMPIWSVKITGRQKMDMKNSYVIVSNHQSQLDILVAYRLFYPFRWVSKAEVFQLPFIGWNMVLNGYVKLRRGDKDSVRQMMDQCEKLLKQNISIILFPEGTRSKTGRVKPFKPGAFILAKKMKKSILPLVINNTKNALPKHSLMIQGKQWMEIRVLDEIPFSTFEHMEIDDIAKMVQKMISSHVKEHIALEQEKYIGIPAN